MDIEDVVETFTLEDIIMPSRNHGRLQARLAALLLMHYEDRLSIFTESTITIDNNNYTPDVLVYPFMPADWLDDELSMSALPLSVIEIISPMQGSKPILDKVKIYLAAGIRSCWVVEPPFKTVTVFTAGTEPKVHIDGVITDATSGISLQLPDIFR